MSISLGSPPAFELPALDEGVDQLQHLALLIRIELLDSQHAAGAYG
jgi:hypothetical protein